jgi:TetR/AcrR family transcriptional regulator, cholesterol catabolism regulator
MKNIKISIIQKASLLFAKHGTQAVSMDDVAKACGISKKTVYLFFERKEELIQKVVETQIEKSIQYLSLYNGISPDAITELNNFFGCIEKMMDIFTPAFLLDVKKYFPDAYGQIQTLVNESMIPFIYKNISRGITEEMYRADLKKDVAGKIYSWELHKAMEESYVSNQSGNQLVCTINNFFIHSLVNSKGKKLLLSK